MIYKYKIEEILNKMPHQKRRFAVRTIPGLLDISLNTFHNYRLIKQMDTQDIPHEIVVAFEKLFQLKPGELYNKFPMITDLDTLYARKG